MCTLGLRPVRDVSSTYDDLAFDNAPTAATHISSVVVQGLCKKAIHPNTVVEYATNVHHLS